MRRKAEVKRQKAEVEINRARHRSRLLAGRVGAIASSALVLCEAGGCSGWRTLRVPGKVVFRRRERAGRTVNARSSRTSTIYLYFCLLYFCLSLCLPLPS